MARRIALFTGLAVVALAGFWLAATTLKQEPDLSRAELIEIARGVFSADIDVRHTALERIRLRGNPDMIAGLILAMRFINDLDGEVAAHAALLAGETDFKDWAEWMLWQEAHPEIEPFDGFTVLKSDLLARIDPGFRDFVYDGMALDIRLEEIVWGGVRAGEGGIPPLNHPKQIAAEQADYLEPADLVFGISINGDARAYPLRIMNWHEMFNDTVGGVDLALAYCTLCGSGILYETLIDGNDAPTLFGSSGLLYRSNKVMYDYDTKSLWNQFTGQPVAGPLTGSGIRLKTRPVAITSWAKWQETHPETTVLSLDTGHVRDYRPGGVYAEYFASDDLMFPALLQNDAFTAKDYVFGMTVPGAEKAWPLSAFDGGAVINDLAGDIAVVLIGDAATRTVRAYERGDIEFAPVDGRDDALDAGGETWSIGEAALAGPDGGSLPRLAGHIAYWFAWTGFRSQVPVYDPP
jgi:hypothetical protein